MLAPTRPRTHIPRHFFAVNVLSRARSRLPRARSRLPRARSRLSRARSRLSRARSRLPRARSRLPRARSCLPRARSRLSRARFRLFAHTQGLRCAPRAVDLYLSLGVLLERAGAAAAALEVYASFPPPETDLPAFEHAVVANCVARLLLAAQGARRARARACFERVHA
eukprot:6176316-Pleurochrysis_carterae.AAC.2